LEGSEGPDTVAGAAAAEAPAPGACALDASESAAETKKPNKTDFAIGLAAVEERRARQADGGRFVRTDFTRRIFLFLVKNH
jgi:hypothetical protein